MARGKKVGADVTPAFYDRLNAINTELEHGSMGETVRHVLREGAKAYDQTSFAQAIFKNAALGLAMVALVGYLWAALIAGYDRPLYVGVVWMVPSVACLWLYELWPGIRARFGRSTDETVTPSEA